MKGLSRDSYEAGGGVEDRIPRLAGNASTDSDASISAYISQFRCVDTIQGHREENALECGHLGHKARLLLRAGPISLGNGTRFTYQNTPSGHTIQATWTPHPPGESPTHKKRLICAILLENSIPLSPLDLRRFVSK